MAITQLSAFLENTPGTLYQAASAISDAGVNLRALSVADTRDFGKEVLSDNVVITQTKVIAAKMNDEAGSLKKILKIIRDTGVNIEYVYAFTSPVAGSAYVVLRVDDEAGAEAVLAQNGIRTLSDEDMNGLL